MKLIRMTAGAGVVLVVAAGLSGCGSEERTTLRVSAAASLTDVFGQLGKEFEAKHPGVDVVFEFGPSSGLAEQIANGSPADVFASASTDTMQQLVDDHEVDDPTDFATNTMMIAVPTDNPAHVSGLTDLTRKGLTLALCDVEVPCGKAAAKVFETNHLTIEPTTREEDVRGVLTKVGLGEVDAGITYVTDVAAVKAAGKVLGITIPAAQNAVTTYPIATVAATKHDTLAGQFVDLVTGPTGQQALRAAGFTGP